MEFIRKAFNGDDKDEAEPEPGKGNLMEGLLGMIKGPEGLQGLLGKFKSAGMEDKASSWVSTGQNAAPTPEDVRKALGDQEISQLAQKAGISEEQASSQLATMIPETVNELTPEGDVPDEGKLDNLLDSIGDRLPESIRRFMTHR